MDESITYLAERRFSHFSTGEKTVTVCSDREIEVKIDVCSPFVFRVQVDRNGEFKKRESFAVPEEAWNFDRYSLEDLDEKLCIHTDILTLEISKPNLGLTYKLRDTGRILLAEYRDEGWGFGVDGSIQACYELEETEHIYGLGEDNDAWKGNLDRRGSSRDLVTGQTINKGCVTADIPIPFMLSTGRSVQSGIKNTSYGLFVDHTFHMEFDAGKEREDCFFWKAAGGQAVTYLIYGPAFQDIINRYTDLTGKPEMLPVWTLGLIQSKCSYQDWDEMDDVIDTLLEKGFPVDALVFDFDWPEHLHNFRWHPRWKGLCAEKIREYNQKGIHFMVSNTGPMIRKDSSNYQDALDHEVMALDADGNTLTCGHYGGDLMDFSAPNMKEWIKKQLIPLMDDGVEGWWLDLTEPEGEPVQTLYRGGPKEELHNVYSYLSSKVYYDSQKEYLPRSRPFILTRTGTPGIQRLGNSIWSGDVYSDYETFSAHCPEALNTGMSGIPYWTSDIGGFISSTYDSSDPMSEQLYRNDAAAHGLLYERWFQFGCFCPITRVHHAGPSEPYRFGSLVEAGCRHYINLRYRLLPYIYSYMWETHNSGLSIMRPLVLGYQNDERVYKIKDEFLFGDYLLAAPVLTEQTTEREVYFPEGIWVDWDYGYEYKGGEAYQVYAPQNRMPLFVKRGAIIPMITERKSTLEKPWDPVILELYPEGESRFTMYQDDGLTTAYQTDHEYTETTVTCTESEESCRVVIERNNSCFVPSVYEFRVHSRKVICGVLCNGKELAAAEGISSYKKKDECFYADALEQLTYIRCFSRRNGTQEITFCYGERVWEKALPGRNMVPEDKQMPYFLPPATVPCKIQAENFDRGGEGIAYHIGHEQNAGGEYRTEAVNIELCSDRGGGYDVFDLEKEEWLEYTINITKNLTAKNLYNLHLRVSCEEPDTFVHIEVDNEIKSGRVQIPVTQGRQYFFTCTIPDITLSDGEHVLKFHVDQGRVNLNFMELEIA